MARARSPGNKTSIATGKPRLASASREEAEERALMYLEAADFDLEEAMTAALLSPTSRRGARSGACVQPSKAEARLRSSPC